MPLAHVVLGDPSHREQLGCLTGQQQLLESAKNNKVATSRGSVDPLLESEQILFQDEPGQAVPANIYWHGLDSIRRLYHPDNRAHVSVSPGFPQGVSCLGNPTAVRHAVGTYSTRESTQGVTSLLNRVFCRT
jgi:hypothetical protein